MAEAVSIVVAVKNALPLLRPMVEATIATPPDSAELVVIDGGSTDGTAAWLAGVAPGGRAGAVSWESLPDSGIAEAWNRGVGRATGRWVVFLGVDDRVCDAASWKAVIDRLRSLPHECGVAAFPVRVVSPRGAFVADEHPQVGSIGRRFPAVNAVPHQGAFHRRSLWTTHGPFDTSFAIAADYEFLLRLHAAGVEIRAHGGDPPVAMAFGGTSKRHPWANVREFRRAQRMHGIRVPPRLRCREWCAAALRCAAAAMVGESVARRLADRVRRLRGLPAIWDVP